MSKKNDVCTNKILHEREHLTRLVSESTYRRVWRRIKSQIRRVGINERRLIQKKLVGLAEEFLARSGWIIGFKNGKTLVLETFNVDRSVVRAIEPQYASCLDSMLTLKAPIVTPCKGLSDSVLVLLPVSSNSGEVVGAVVLACRINRQSHIQQMINHRIEEARTLDFANYILNRLTRTDSSLPFSSLERSHLFSLLESICGDIAKSISPSCQCMLWYSDPSSESLSVIATTGFDNEYFSRRRLPMKGSFIGDIACSVNATTNHIGSDPVTFFRRGDKADAMGVHKVKAQAVSCGSAKLVLATYLLKPTVLTDSSENKEDESCHVFPRNSIYREILSFFNNCIGTFVSNSSQNIKSELQNMVYDPNCTMSALADLLRNRFDACHATIEFRNRQGTEQHFSTVAEGYLDEQIGKLLEKERSVVTSNLNSNCRISTERRQVGRRETYCQSYSTLTGVIVDPHHTTVSVQLLRLSTTPSFLPCDEDILSNVLQGLPIFASRALTLHYCEFASVFDVALPTFASTS